MKINFLNTSYNYQPIQYHKQENRVSYPNLAPLSCDTVNFGALKKSKFSGIDLFVVERFKAPIEKFNSNQDFQDWSQEKYDSYLTRIYHGKHFKTKTKRAERLEEWDNALKDNESMKPATKLLIINSITSDLKFNDDTLPPAYDDIALDKSLSDLREKLKSNPKGQYSFGKIYYKNLLKEYIIDSRENNDPLNWLILPSKDKDPEGFEDNVKKLQTLSLRPWCTKSYIAENYLERGDFHFLLENGTPKIGVLFKDGDIVEIQSEKNDNTIPPKYFESIKKHITEDNQYKLSMTVRKAFEKATSVNTKINKIKKKLGPETIENADAAKILKYYSIGYKQDEDGNLTIKKYAPPSPDYSYRDLGIDENKMFEKIVRIEGDALFYRDNLNSVHNLKSVGGNVYLKDSKLTPKDFENVYIRGTVMDADRIAYELLA